MNNPLVSICIPTYNSEKYLAQCLDTIKAQTYKNVEVIFSDNGSIDSTLVIIKEYCNQSNWTYSVNDVNIGALRNFNRLIGLANGDYIAIYHADDLYDSRIVESTVNLLLEHNSVFAVGTMANVIDEDGTLVSKYVLPDGIHSSVAIDIATCVEGIVSICEDTDSVMHQLFITPSMMVKKSAYDELGGFACNSPFGSAADYEMWLRIALKYKIIILDRPLMSYRIHDDQGSQNEIRQNLAIPDIIYVLREYKKHICDKDMLGKFDYFVNKVLFGTALKQNKYSLFSTSNATLQHVYNGYHVFKVVLYVCNIIKFSLRRIL